MTYCSICNIEFVRNTNNQKYCSNVCVKISGQKRSKKKQNSIQKIGFCVFCLNNFSYFYRPDRGDRKFCNRSCASKLHIKNGTFESWRTHKNKKQGIHVECNWCKNQIYIVKHQFKQATHFCNMKCKGKYFGSKYSGSGNPMFNKKLSSEQKEKQRNSLFSNHGVTNAFMLAKHRTISTGQQSLCDELNVMFPDKAFMPEQFFKSGSYQFHLDIVSEPLKLVIEYNGDYWHCNPKIYSGSYFHPKKKKTAEEIWKYDNNRLKILQNNGYETMVVWEHDFRKNTSETIQMLNNEINKRCVSG